MKLIKYDSQVERQNCVRERLNRMRQLAGLTLALAGLISGISFRGYCQQVSHHSINAVAASSGWVFTGNLNTPRALHTATLVRNGKVLVAGGNGSVINSSELYDPDTGSWSITGNLNVAREGHTATLLPNGRVLVVGGSDLAGNSLNNSELYDSDTGTWSITSNLNAPRSAHTATLLQSGKVLVAGGQLDVNSVFRNMVDIAELFDPNTETWSITSSPRVPRYGHTATLLANGKVLVAGGAGGKDGFDFPLLKHAELYDPAKEKWSDTGSLGLNHYLHSAILLPNGKVLVAGGGTTYDLSDFLIETNSAELYDPATGKWSETGHLRIERDSHTTAVMPDGNVLAAGGNVHDSPPVNSVELYNPETGRWSTSLNLNLNRGRYSHTSTLLANGKVLVAGGNGGLSSAELYDPTALVIPKITGASVAGKKLFLLGQNFDLGALILLNGEEQKTLNDDLSPRTTLIGRKTGKRIMPGDKIQVRNPDGTISEVFTFTGLL